MRMEEYAEFKRSLRPSLSITRTYTLGQWKTRTTPSKWDLAETTFRPSSDSLDHPIAEIGAKSKGNDGDWIG